MDHENDTPIEIGPDHTFTVLATTKSPDDIVEKGDEQTWIPPQDDAPGRLLVKRDETFWKDKQFAQVGKNTYQAKYTEAGKDFVINLLFEQVRDLTAHKEKMWMIYGSRTLMEEGCDLLDGPPRWGGQNGQ